MRQYKLKKTLSEFRRRLAHYPPTALRDAKRALQKIEEKHEIIVDDRDAADVILSAARRNTLDSLLNIER